MEAAEKEVKRLLREAGATLERHGKHPVYRLPDGSNYVLSWTLGCAGTWKATLAGLRRKLGLQREKASAPDSRHRGRRKPGAPKPVLTLPEIAAGHDWHQDLRRLARHHGWLPAAIPLRCQSCGTTFPFTVGEQKFYKAQGYSSPKRCKVCRREKRAA
jgi:hypothetical protein